MKKLLISFLSLAVVLVISMSAFAQDQSSHGLVPQSDAKISNVYVQTPASPDVWNGRAFGYNAYGTAVPLGPLKFFLNAPGTLTSLATDAGNFVSAGSFDGSGNWWGVRYGNNQLIKIDTTTGAITLVGTVTGAASVTGLAWDPTTSTMFAMNYATNSFLGTLNLSTYAFTSLGGSVTGIVIDIACSNAGAIYGVNIGDDMLWAINKTTGAGTVVGSLGAAANYAQGMSWDRTVDSCYWASYTTLGELRRINTTTGASTLIGATNVEMDGLAIPGSAGPQIQHTPLSNTQNLAGPYVVNCTITPPSGSTISYAKLFWSRNNPTVTDSVALTAGTGNNYSGNIPGNGSAATYRYYLKAIDNNGKVGLHPGGAPASLNTFLAIATDTTKPAIVHVPITECPRAQWPKTVNASATHPIGVDSVWVTWKNGTTGAFKRFNLTKGSGNNWSGPFNSDTSQVAVGNTIYYRVHARSSSAQQVKDSTAQYSFNIINQITVTIGSGTTAGNFPFTTYWMDGRTQYLYTAANLGLPTGYIQQVGFDIVSRDPAPLNDFKISIKQTALTALTAFETTGFTTCYGPVAYTIPATGWQLVTLTTPFFYTTGTNIIIEVCYNNSSYTQYSTVNTTATTGDFYGRYGDLATGDGCATTTWSSTTAPVGKANTRIVFNPGTGITNLNNGTPQTYTLNQNYPNPFNPTTKINFAIPKQGLVTLKIYDVLGREVTNLVNEVKTAGFYSVDFNASDLSSGVYFYRLEVNGFVDVKRMVFMK